MYDFPSHAPEFKPPTPAPINPQPHIKKLSEKQHKVQNLINNINSPSKQTRNDTVRDRVLPRPQKNPKPPTKEAAELRNSTYNLMDISLLPSSSLKEEYALKQQFLDAHLPIENAAQLINQERQHPIIHTAVAELKASFSDWNTYSFKEKQQISCQLKNLIRLSRLLADHKLPAKNLSIKDHEFLKPFLQGDKEFTNANLVLVKKLLLTPNPTDPQPATPNDNLRPTLIQAQARLFEHERKALTIAGTLNRLQNEGISANQVTFLRDPAFPDNQPVAVYKETKGNLQASGIMEELFWELGQLTHNEELLVPTKRTHMRSAEEMQPNAGSETGFDWATDSVRSDLGIARRGGIQPFEEGMTLHEWIYKTDDKPAITKQSVLEHAHFLRKMGAYDYHSNNIYVTPEGKLKLFDNTRSLPHSNHAIYTRNDMNLPFRFAFYDNPHAKEPLTAEDRAYLKSEIAKDRNDIPIIKKFLELPSTQAKIAQLPLGWWSTELVLNAMEERVQLMENAINNPNIQTINDFMLFSQPNAKFAFACQALSSASDHFHDHSLDDQLLFHMEITSLPNHINSITQLGYDPIEIYRLAEDPNLTFDQMIDQLANLVQLHRNDLEPSQYISRGAKLKMALARLTYADCKDMSPANAAANIRLNSDATHYFKKLILTGLEDRFAVLGIPYFEDTGFAEHFNTQGYPCYAITSDADQNLRLYYKGIDGTSKMAELNYTELEDDIDSPQLLSHFTLSDVQQMAPDYFWHLNDQDTTNVISHYADAFLLKVDDQHFDRLMLYISDKNGNVGKIPVIPHPPQQNRMQMYDIQLPQETIQMTLDELEAHLQNEELLAPLSNSVSADAAKNLRVLKQHVRAAGCDVWPHTMKHEFHQMPAPFYCMLYDESTPLKVTFHYKGTSGNERFVEVNTTDPRNVLIETLPLQEFIAKIAPYNFYSHITPETAAALLKDDPKGWILGCDKGYLCYHYRINDHNFSTYFNKVGSLPDTFKVKCLDGSTQTMAIWDLMNYMTTQGYHPHIKT